MNIDDWKDQTYLRKKEFGSRSKNFAERLGGRQLFRYPTLPSSGSKLSAISSHTTFSPNPILLPPL